VHGHSNQLIIFHGLDHQPSPRGWAESSPQYMGRVRPSPEWLGQVRPSFFLKKKFKNIFFGILQFSRVFFMSFWLISSSIFMLLKIQKSNIKIPGFRQNYQNTKKTLKKRKKCFCAYGQVSQKLKDHSVFFTPKNNVLACILALITSLLKSREHWPKFQKQQKNFVCLLVFGVRYYM